jgi:hypothetical protein
MALMIFKSPGPELIHGVMVQWKIVDETAIETYLADGWKTTAVEAGQAVEERLAAEEAARRAESEQQAAAALADDTRPPSREELEQMATRLGLPFNARISDKKLRAMVDAAAKAEA